VAVNRGTSAFGHVTGVHGQRRGRAVGPAGDDKRIGHAANLGDRAGA
jgi:hypothetical protein